MTLNGNETQNEHFWHFFCSTPIKNTDKDFKIAHEALCHIAF